MSNKIFGCKIIEGVEFIKKVLDEECITFEYVTHSEAVHRGPNYITHAGLPMIFIQKSGIAGYYLYLDTMDEEFNRVEGFMIRFNTYIDCALKAQEIFNRLLLQHEREKV